MPCKLLAGLLLAALATGELRAQNIDPLVTEKNLTNDQTATIEVWVNKRAAQLAKANSEKDIKKVEEAFIDVVTKTKPSSAFAIVYSVKCGENLGPVTGQSAEQIDLLRALAAVRILHRLDHPGTARGLAEALRSPHACVRYVAAKAIQALHPKITNAQDLDAVLAALGEAAATETANYVLRELYLALDFKTGAANFKSGNVMAGGLAKAFAGRATRLGEGARDEATDLAGLNAALSVAADANATNRKQLASAVISLMSIAIERHLDPQTNATQRKTLDQLVRKEEEIIEKLIVAANGTAPTDRVSATLSGANPSAKAVREAFDKWQSAVNGL